MTKPKTPPAIEARLQEAREARADAAASREARSGRPPRRPQDIAAARSKLEKRRGQMRRHAERGELRRWGIVPLAEAFSDEELRDLLLADAAGQERKAALAERRLEREEGRLARVADRARAGAGGPGPGRGGGRPPPRGRLAVALRSGASSWSWLGEEPPPLSTVDDIGARLNAAAHREILEQHAPSDEREYITVWEGSRDPSGRDYPSVGTRAEEAQP